mgnify:CR=1 FL=1
MKCDNCGEVNPKACRDGNATDDEMASARAAAENAAGKGTLERLVRRVKSPSALSCFARHIPAGICFDCGRTFAGPFARVKIRFHSCETLPPKGG